MARRNVHSRAYHGAEKEAEILGLAGGESKDFARSAAQEEVANLLFARRVSAEPSRKLQLRRLVLCSCE